MFNAFSYTVTNYNLLTHNGVNKLCFKFFSPSNLENAEHRCYTRGHKSFCHHRGANSQPRAQHTDVQSPL